MIVLLAALAAASPISPGSAQPEPFTFEISGVLGTEQLTMRAPNCDGDCIAIRRESFQGGELALWFVPGFAAYGGGAHEAENTAAATYTGEGFRIHGGVKGGARVSHALAVDGWAQVTHTETAIVNITSAVASEAASENDAAKRNQIEVGAALRLGQVDGGVDAWVGVEVMPYSYDYTSVIQGQALIRLVPVIPVNGIIGLRIVSGPLGPPWSERGRLSAGVTGSAGYRLGVTGWVTASL